MSPREEQLPAGGGRPGYRASSGSESLVDEAVAQQVALMMSEGLGTRVAGALVRAGVSAESVVRCSAEVGDPLVAPTRVFCVV